MTTRVDRLGGCLATWLISYKDDASSKHQVRQQWRSKLAWRWTIGLQDQYNLSWWYKARPNKGTRGITMQLGGKATLYECQQVMVGWHRYKGMVGNDMTMLQCVASGGTVALQGNGRQQCKDIFEGCHDTTIEQCYGRSITCQLWWILCGL